MSAADEPDTVESEIVACPPGRDRPPPFSSQVRVDLGGLSHRGKVRPKNEDHFLMVRFGRYLEPLGTNLPEGEIPSWSEETGYGMAVADGMGGHPAGEQASRLAISILVNLVLNTPDWILRLDDDSFFQEVMRRAEDRIRQLNTAMSETAEADPGYGVSAPP
jgi:protein phosphatase